jgi:hypothetical protein
VYWQFKLDTGRRSGHWQLIPVPSQWEQQGFGTYYYGTQGRGKPDDDPVIPKETALYRRSFDVPTAWRDREVHVVFEAVMTDTTVFVNGRQAGKTHQGGFYRFAYDITPLLQPGRNEMEVRVSKESANHSVNHAERRGDYWTFGGIYRPVWLEARPRRHIEWTAIDARADGSFTAHVHLNQASSLTGEEVIAEVFDAAGQRLGKTLSTPARVKDPVLRGRFERPASWTAETPHLHTVKFTLLRHGTPRHELTQRFGFRTFEVRANDGVYLNGRRIVLKGVNRHSFRPATGRTLSRAQNFEDARLIKSMNMNAVRMSHYPPDPAFLEAADELGLYVLNELAGWQGFYDTPTGARLIGQIVRRDVNHPSILFWNNGNEGGWNTANDGEFARWDPQRRPVLHPWAIHDDINTDHYERFENTVRLSQGPQIFMPTEFLHGLYDGGIGAGLEDYWKVMGASPTVAGGFFWALADEGIERTDRERRIDNMGNAAPDGIVGPHHEKEGSFFAVKQIWSPVQVADLSLVDGVLRMTLRNEYDFTGLERCNFTWRIRSSSPSGSLVRAQGRMPGPRLAARQRMSWAWPVSIATLSSDEWLELTAHDARGHDLWTWTLAGQRPSNDMPVDRDTRRRIVARGQRITAGPWALELAPDGEIVRLQKNGQFIQLQGPSLLAMRRSERRFAPAGLYSKRMKLDIAPRRERDVIARATWQEGTLRSLTWRLVGEELRVAYELDPGGEFDILGLRFEAPSPLTKRWLGAGPYRVWKNRMTGTQFGAHQVSFNDPVPGESYAMPEFPGFFGEWRWLELSTAEGRVRFRNLTDVPYFGLHRPQPGKQPVIELPDLGWSFLHAIAPIGTKFDLPETLGPQSQTTRIDGLVRGEIALDFEPTVPPAR